MGLFPVTGGREARPNRLKRTHYGVPFNDRKRIPLRSRAPKIVFHMENENTVMYVNRTGEMPKPGVIPTASYLLRSRTAFENFCATMKGSSTSLLLHIKSGYFMFSPSEFALQHKDLINAFACLEGSVGSINTEENPEKSADILYMKGAFAVNAAGKIERLRAMPIAGDAVTEQAIKRAFYMLALGLTALGCPVTTEIADYNTETRFADFLLGYNVRNLKHIIDGFGIEFGRR